MKQHQVKILKIVLKTLIYYFVFSIQLACKNKNDGGSNSEVFNPPLESNSFISIFNGKTLKIWKGDPKYWSVENGNLTGIITHETLLSHNTFIVWEGGEPSDFELKLEFRISKEGNSGINYRSEYVDTIPFTLKGYQADIDGQNRYTRQNYEEKKRTILAYRGEKVIINSQDNPDGPNSLSDNITKNC
jgi:hypothetical protein